MVAVLGTLVFVAALVTAVGTIWLSVAPQWQRIVRLAFGQVEQPFHPLERLVTAERRIAVRRWASVPVSAPARMRAAA